MYKYFKIHACGNNFLIIYKNDIFLINKLLNKIGIGCDQLLIINNIYYKSKIIEIKIYNNNLIEAKNCGNGIRCLGYYYLKKNKKKIFINFKICKNYVYSFKNKNIFTVYKFPIIKSIILRINNFFFKVFFVNLINHHLVFFIKNINSIYIKKLINIILYYFEDNYNLEFIKISKFNNIYIRIYEKNVGETLSCGSGIISSISILYNYINKNNIFLINSIGGSCLIYINKKYIIIFGKVEFCFYIL